MLQHVQQHGNAQCAYILTFLLKEPKIQNATISNFKMVPFVVQFFSQEKAWTSTTTLCQLQFVETICSHHDSCLISQDAMPALQNWIQHSLVRFGVLGEQCSKTSTAILSHLLQNEHISFVIRQTIHQWNDANKTSLYKALIGCLSVKDMQYVLVYLHSC